MPSIKIPPGQPLKRVQIISAEDISLGEPPEPFLFEEEAFDEPELEAPLPKNFIDPDARSEEESIGEERKTTRATVIWTESRIPLDLPPIQISYDRIPEPAMPLDEVRKEVQEAYDRGFEDARQVTKSTYDVELDKHRDWMLKIDSIVKKIRRDYLEQIENLEDSIIVLSRKIAEHILMKEISAEGEIVIEQTKKALDSLDNEKVFTIRVNPEDADILRNIKSELFLEAPELERVEVVGDGKIERGGCTLTTSAGLVNARIKTQLDKVQNKLEEIAVDEKYAEEQTLKDRSFDEEISDFSDFEDGAKLDKDQNNTDQDTFEDDTAADD